MKLKNNLKGRFKMKYISLLLATLLLFPMVLAETTYRYYDTYPTIEFTKADNYVSFVINSPYNEFKALPNNYKYKIEYDTNLTAFNILYFNATISEWLPLNSTKDNIGVVLRLLVGENPDVVIDTCSKYLENVTQTSTWFHDSYNLCINQRQNFELQILNDMVNKTYHDEIETNLTTKFTNLESEYENYKNNKEMELKVNDERIVTLEKHRQWGWGLAIVGIGTALFTLNKYRGLGKRKQQIETEFPKDVAV